MSIDIAVSIPSLGTWRAEFGVSLAGMVARVARALPTATLRFNLVKGSVLPKLRSELVSRALEVDATHILFLDDDIVFPPDALERLLAHDKDIVAANYLTRHPPHRCVAIKDGLMLSSEGRSGVEEVGHVGLGLALIRRTVFEQMTPPWFLIGWHDERRQFIGEDVSFCWWAREAGFSVWVDHDLSRAIGHIGETEFRLR